MNALSFLGIPAFTAMMLALLLIPPFKKIASRIGLMDKPNVRKVHQAPVPLVGGWAIALATMLALLLRKQFIGSLPDNIVWIIGAFIMLLVGTLDDRFTIKPLYRLLIQLGVAASVASSGVRITSLQGIVGIHELSLPVQFALTSIVIAGVVNAYNLMDGIDGLLGGLTILGAAVLGIISYQLGDYALTILYAALAGAIVGFLRHNLGGHKVFMGDAGSMFLGFTLVTTAIKLLTAVNGKPHLEPIKILLAVIAIFLVPVVDSLRVYRARIKKGLSPFTADKTHIHHLFLFLGITHKKAALLIIVLVAVILGVIAGLLYLIPAVWTILLAVMLFAVITTLLTLNRSVQEWKEKIKKLEQD